MGVTVLIPYYSQYEPGAHSEPSNRPGYLERTVDSVAPLADRVIVAVVAGEQALPSVHAATLELHCAPRFLPVSLLRWAQANLGPGPDRVFFTEADQVLHYDPAVLAAVQGGDYLVPHRLEELGQLGEGADRGPVVEHAGKQWVLPNGTPEGDGFYHPQDPGFEMNRFLQYGAAFLAGRDLLAEAAFTDSDDRPLEHGGGFCMSAAGNALKTSDWERFWVEHLSGHEHNERLGGR